MKVIETRKEMLGGNEVAVLRLDSGGAQVTWYVSPTDGRLLRSVTQVASPAGMVDAVVDYSDWRVCDGLAIPFLRAMTIGGKVGEEKILSVDLNPSMPAAPARP